MFRKILAPLVLIAFVTGCTGVPMPETPRQKLAFAETTYQGLVDTATDMARRGVIEPDSDTAYELYAALVTARAALDEWQLSPDSVEHMNTTLTALRAVKSVLDVLERRLRSQPTSGDGVNGHRLVIVLPRVLMGDIRWSY